MMTTFDSCNLNTEAEDYNAEYEADNQRVTESKLQ